MKTHFKKNGGFTLVELIVVIAILAILAAVAIPAYSGYIAKAEKAGDLQLLGAINTAFNAACIAEGTQTSEITSAILEWNGNCVVGIAKIGGTYNEGIDDSFQMFFKGNETSEFKTLVNKIGFVNGVFVEGSGNMSMADIDRYLNVFNNSNMAGKTEELAGSVGNLSSALADQLDDGTLNLEFWMGDDYQAFMADYNLGEESSGTEIANATIMYTASKMEGVTAQTIVDIAGEDLSNMNEVIETYGQIPTAAMMYGVVTGYANSEYASDAFKAAYATPPTGIGDVNTLVATMQSDANFSTYLNNTGANGAMADMDGYLAAMQVINGHDGTFDLTKSDAFTNDEILGLMNSILGIN